MATDYDTTAYLPRTRTDPEPMPRWPGNVPTGVVGLLALLWRLSWARVTRQRVRFRMAPDAAYAAPERIRAVRDVLGEALDADRLSGAGRVVRLRARYEVHGPRWAAVLADYAVKNRCLPPT